MLLSHVLLSHNARLHPERAVTGGITERKHSENKFDILPSQRAEIKINDEIFSIILFAECPEVAHESIGELIVHAQKHAAGCRAAFAVDDPLEAVTVLHFEGWVDRADIPIVDVLWSHQQAGVQRG